MWSSLDWKWLFIYPDAGVASLNKLVLPVGTPLRFHMTSATVMNSFFIPQLGSQVYTMAGMATKLNLMVDDPGLYHGLSAQFSGEGFSDMTFEVSALERQDFEQWLDATRTGGGTLDAAAYEALTHPSAQGPRAHLRHRDRWHLRSHPRASRRRAQRGAD